MKTILHRLMFPVTLVLFAPGTPEASAQTNTNNAEIITITTRPPTPRPTAREGFRLELVANHALVESPAAMAFDELGRLFVAELRDYPASSSGETLTGRIRLLEDSDGDGVFDTSVVYADNLKRPTAVACSRGGVFVAGPSELTYLLDQDGDDIADLRRTLLSFNVPPPYEEPAEFTRSMTWGPDRRIYVALPSADAEVLNSNAPDRPPLKLLGGGFSFDPLTLQLRAESGVGVTGQSFDDGGRRFVCSPSTALAVTLLSADEAHRNPYSPAMPTSAMLVPNRGNGAPLDCLIYRGDAYPTNLHGQAFLADPVAGAVFMVSLRNEGNHPTVVAHEGRVRVPLITSTDTSFRPTRLVTAPDDFLYVADLGRKVYPGGKPLSTAPSDNEVRSSGRIWRLVPSAPSPEEAPPPDFSNTESLAAELGNSNAWIRSTAARLLLEGRATNPAPRLREALSFSKMSLVRVESLRSLEAAGAATVRDLTQALGDGDRSIRIAATAMAAERVRNGRLAPSLWTALRSLSADTSPEVRLRVGLALGSVRVPPPSTLLADLCVNDAKDVWMQRAVLTAHPDTLTPLLIELLREAEMRQSPAGRELLRHLATSIGLGGELGDVSDCLGALRDLDTPVDLAFPIITALADGLEGRGLRLPEADEAGHWLVIANTAQTVAVKGSDEQIRSDAVNVLGACVGPDFVADEYLLLLFAPGLPVTMQIPVIHALARQGLDRDFAALTQRWHLWDAQERLATIDALLQSGNGANALLSAVADKTIPVEALTSVHINLLREDQSDSIRTRAQNWFGAGQPDRDEVVATFLGAVDLHGSVAQGRELFGARCAYCHRSGPPIFGPPLSSLRTQGALQLVVGTINPSREMNRNGYTTVLQLSNGRRAWGVANEIHPGVTQLTTPEGTRRYLRSVVGSFEQTDWSLMPDNAAAGLTRQDVADLVQFIQNSTFIR